MASQTVQVELDSGWETLGRDRFVAAKPENISVRSNSWGNDTCTFFMARDPSLTHLDIAAFTPIQVYEEGMLLFEGRVKETPVQEGDNPGINVVCEGWQYHLDDDLYEQVYVHSRLTDWADWRSDTRADLAIYRTSWTVEAGEGGVTLAYPPGPSVRSLDGVAAFVSFPDPQIKRAVFDVDTSANGGANTFLQIFGYDSDFLGGAVYGQTLTTVGGSNTIAVTFPNLVSWVFVVMIYTGSLTAVGGDGHFVKVKAARLFGATAYEAGNVSVLKASQVIVDAAKKAPLLSGSTLGIGSTLFNVPDFAATGPQTPRTYMDTANSYHHWRLRVGRDRAMEYAAQVTQPKYVVGSWGARNFQDQSANSGEDIYNRAVLSATGPDGRALRVERWASQLPGVPLEPVASPLYGGGGSIGSNNSSTTLFTGSWQAGISYRVDIPVSVTAPVPTPGVISPQYVGLVALRDGLSGPFVASPVRLQSTTPIPYSTTVSLSWLPRQSVSSVALLMQSLGGGAFSWSNVRIYRTVPSLVDRKGFIRSKNVDVSSAIPADAATQILDVWLANHVRTPFKGGGTFFPGDIRAFDSGRPIHPRELAMGAPTELIHFSHLTDPDTGAAGRDGVIDSVDYTSDSESVQITVDSSRDNLEALLARYQIISG